MTGFRFVLAVEPEGPHPKAPKAAVWRMRSDDEHFWIANIMRRGADSVTVSQSLALLIVDGAVSFLPVILLPAHPGMAIIQQNGSINNNLGQRLTQTAQAEVRRIAAELRSEHGDYVKDLAEVARSGRPSAAMEPVPSGHLLRKGLGRGDTTWFAPPPPTIPVRGRWEDYRS